MTLIVLSGGLALTLKRGASLSDPRELPTSETTFGDFADSIGSFSGTVGGTGAGCCCGIVGALIAASRIHEEAAARG